MALFTEQQIRARFESEKSARNSRGYRYFSATEASRANVNFRIPA